MTTRKITEKRLAHNTSSPHRTVTSVTPDVSKDLSRVDDQKVTSTRNFKDEKLVAGVQAMNKHNYVKAIKQFTLIKPDTTTSLYLCGCARLELQYYSQIQKAIVDFTNCIELSSKTERPQFGLEVWYKRALAYHNINKYDEAIRDYTEFINYCQSLGEQEDSEIHRGLIGRGRTYQVIYELDAAMQDMNEANHLTNNTNPYYLCCQASVHASKHEREKAIENIEKATLVHCDKNIEALFQRAIVLAELGRYNAALEDFRKVLALTTNPVQQSNICFRCGISEYVLNNQAEAFKWFERAITLHHYHAQPYFYLGKMQIEKEHYKEALKSLNRAHELAPQQGDILLERAIANQNLGQLDNAAIDRKRGMLLNSSSFAIITMLANRIKTLQEEIDRTGVSSYHHLELAKSYDGLLGQKKDIEVKIEYYKVAIIEYRAAIESDTKYVYPQARALLSLCQKKMNNLIEAHESHLEFYNLLGKHKGAIYYWKTYLLNVKDNMEAGKLEPYLDETAVSKLIHMEVNRRKKDIDEETFQNDLQDKHKNQLAFYQQMRIDLSNVLAAVSVLNLDHKSIINNTEDSMNKVGKIIELLCEGQISVPAIQSALNSRTKVNIGVIRNADHNIIKMRLKAIGNVGDLIDQLDVAQLVARHLCTRYRSQLICLQPNHHNSDNVEVIEEKSSCWSFCGSSQKVSSKQSTYFYEEETIKKLSTLAIAFIIQAISSDTITISSNKKSERKDALATTLVLIVCQAHQNIDTILSSSPRLVNENLPIDLTAISEMSKNSQLLNRDSTIGPIEWKLYSFFSAPGIYYHSDNNTGHIYHYDSGPLMIPDIYGYRLGTKEEVDVFKRLKLKEK